MRHDNCSQGDTTTLQQYAGAVLLRYNTPPCCVNEEKIHPSWRGVIYGCVWSDGMGVFVTLIGILRWSRSQLRSLCCPTPVLLVVLCREGGKEKKSQALSDRDGLRSYASKRRNSWKRSRTQPMKAMIQGAGRSTTGRAVSGLTRPDGCWRQQQRTQRHRAPEHCA